MTTYFIRVIVMEIHPPISKYAIIYYLLLMIHRAATPLSVRNCVISSPRLLVSCIPSTMKIKSHHLMIRPIFDIAILSHPPTSGTFAIKVIQVSSTNY